MKETNGVAMVASRAKQFAVIVGAILLGQGTISAIQAKFVTGPATAAAVGAIHQEGDTLRKLIRGEGAIRDASDLAMWASFDSLRREVRSGVYRRSDIDAMRAASYHRQDSLFRLVLALTRRK